MDPRLNQHKMRIGITNVIYVFRHFVRDGNIGETELLEFHNIAIKRLIGKRPDVIFGAIPDATPFIDTSGSIFAVGLLNRQLRQTV